MEHEGSGYSKVEITGIFRDSIEKYVVNKEYAVYKANLECKRLSGVVDIIEINMQERIANAANKLIGKHIKIEGDLRTYKVTNGCNRTIVFAHDIYEIDESCNEENTVYVKGSRLDIRKTTNKSGVAVCESKIDIRSKYGKSSRVSIVAWGHLAGILTEIKKNSTIVAKGRLQYRKLASYDGRADIGRVEIAVYELEEEREDV